MAMQYIGIACITPQNVHQDDYLPFIGNLCTIDLLRGYLIAGVLGDGVGVCSED